MKPRPARNRLTPPADRGGRARPYSRGSRLPYGGFTLFELMVVVLIMTIAAGLAVPLLKGSDESKLRAAAKMLTADLEYTQSESIAHGDALRVVVFDSAAGSYRVATAAAPATALTHPGDKQPYTTTFGAGRAASLSGVSISGYSLGGDAKLGFGMYGQLDQATAATITLASGSRTLTLTLDPITGVVTLGAIQ